MLWLLALLGCRETLVPGVGVPDRDPSRAWGETLRAVVTADGYVDYDALEANRTALDDYVAWLGSERAWQGRMTKDWHAQYLNAYNALVLFQVLARGRPSSVKEGGGRLAGFRFFYGTDFRLGVETLSLAEIEHERIRLKEIDYRDHAALNCASASCPPLRRELYRIGILARQLDEQMTAWVMDDARGVRIEGEQAVFNPIFDWYSRDFSFTSAGKDLCEIAAEHAKGDKRTALYALSRRGCPHRFFAYDWSLNDAKDHSTK